MLVCESLTVNRCLLLQVLIIIAMTCMLSLGFIALVMGCVHCCTTGKSKEALQEDGPFPMA